MIRTQISLTEEQAEALRHLAALRAKSQSAVIREAVDEITSATSRASAVERARQVIGAFASGATDTSEAHDAELDEAYGA